jgi:hypothetical protein
VANDQSALPIPRKAHLWSYPAKRARNAGHDGKVIGLTEIGIATFCHSRAQFDKFRKNFCGLVVVDFTRKNSNVYFEGGASKDLRASTDAREAVPAIEVEPKLLATELVKSDAVWLGTHQAPDSDVLVQTRKPGLTFQRKRGGSGVQIVESKSAAVEVPNVRARVLDKAYALQLQGFAARFILVVFGLPMVESLSRRGRVLLRLRVA